MYGKMHTHRGLTSMVYCLFVYLGGHAREPKIGLELEVLAPRGGVLIFVLVVLVWFG
jgi:hypothetical protein